MNWVPAGGYYLKFEDIGWSYMHSLEIIFVHLIIS
jgi:hypothetical protein